MQFNGHAASTLDAGSVGQVGFPPRISPGLLGRGAKWALTIYFVGGLFPAVYAARMPVATARCRRLEAFESPRRLPLETAREQRPGGDCRASSLVGPVLAEADRGRLTH